MIDEQLFYNINILVGQYDWLDVLAIFLAQYLPYFLAVCLAFFAVKDFKKYWPMLAEAAVAALAGRFIFVELIRLLHDRFRPFLGSGVNNLLTYPSPDAFPSGHATVFFAISLIVAFYNRKAAIAFFTASLFIGAARVFTGLHWPIDVAAGIIVGLITGLLVHFSYLKIRRATIKK